MEDSSDRCSQLGADLLYDDGKEIEAQRFPEDFDGIEDDIDFEESEDNQEVPDSEAGEAPDLISEPELISGVEDEEENEF